MKKIGIDARLYFQTGVGVYLRNLLFYLQKQSPDDFIFNIYLMKNDAKKINFSNKNFIKREIIFPWHSFTEQIDFGKILYQDNLDLMHFTYFSYPITYKKKFIATVHDTTPLTYKTGMASTKNPVYYEVKHFFFRIVISSQIRNALTIITPTNTVKEQIIQLFGQTIAKKIHPLYEGINFELINSTENQALGKKFKRNFFIYTGNFYPHKNVERLIEAFAKVNNNSLLILIGPNSYFSERLARYIKKLNRQDKIIFFHNPSHSDMIYFYKHAQALINPSLSEGFGLPLVEAAYFNLPIIASDIPVFKELFDIHYLAFNPLDVNDIANKIKIFIDNKPKFEYRELLKNYSFAKMTKDTLELYKKIVNQ